MTITKTIQGIRLSTILDNHLFTRHYIGYSMTEAKKKFRKEIRSFENDLYNIWDNN